MAGSSHMVGETRYVAATGVEATALGPCQAEDHLMFLEKVAREMGQSMGQYQDALMYWVLGDHKCPHCEKPYKRFVWFRRHLKNRHG